MSRVRPLLLCVLASVTACAGGYRAASPSSAASMPVESAGPPGGAPAGALDAHLDAAHASLARDPEQRRLDSALRARGELRARLVALGAIPRPPMPAPLAEAPGEPPFPGAHWIPGRWEWGEGRWRWRAGYWSAPPPDDETGGLAIGVSTGATIGFDLFDSSGSDERVRDHRDSGSSNVRDHRTDRSDGARIRDHRDDPRPTPTVRDHRDGRDDNGDDKRDDKRDDDRGARIRDHRR